MHSSGYLSKILRPQDIGDFPSSICEGCEDHGCRPAQETGHHLRSHRNLPAGQDTRLAAGRGGGTHRRRPEGVPLQDRLVGLHVHLE